MCLLGSSERRLLSGKFGNQSNRDTVARSECLGHASKRLPYSRYDGWISYKEHAVITNKSNRGLLPENDSLEKILEVCESHCSLDQAQKFTIWPCELTGKRY